MTPDPTVVTDPQTARIEALLDTVLTVPTDRQESALEAICAQEPSLAATLRRRWAALASLGLLDDAGGEQGLAVPRRVGEFELEERIGGGGMGVVYRARQTSIGRIVALKLIRPELVFFDNQRRRFEREIAAVARLDHRGIVPVYAAGEAHGMPFLAMQLVEGCPLNAALSRLAGRAAASQTPQDMTAALGFAAPWCRGSWRELAARIALEIGDALVHAHGRGIIHRDVKPSNVMLAADGRVLLLDFGLAFATGGERLTRTLAQLGSLGYTPPEQLQGRSVDARADVFALGTLLYELLALQPPFNGSSPEDTIRRTLTREPPDLRQVNPTVGDDLVAIVAKALEKEPERRYPDMAAFVADLSAFLEYRPITAERQSVPRRVQRWMRREPWQATLVGVLAFGVLLAVGTAGFWAAKWPVLEAGEAKLRAEARERTLALGYFYLSRQKVGSQQEQREAQAAFQAVLHEDPGLVEAQAGLAQLEQQPRTASLDLAVATPIELFTAATPLIFSDRAKHGPQGAQRAVELLRLAIERQAVARPLYHYQLACAIGHTGDLRASQAMAATLTQLWPDEALAWYWAGYVLLELDPGNAVARLRQAVALDPEFAEAWSDLGLVLLTRAPRDQPGNGVDARAAQAAFARAVDLKPNNAQARIGLARACEAVGDLAKALAESRAAVDADPELPGAHYSLGRTLAQQGQLDEAVTALERTLALNPDYALAHHDLGVVQLQRHDYHASAHAFRAEVALTPDSVEGWRGLGSALAHGEDARGAATAYQRVVELAPDNREDHDYLVSLLEHLGDHAALLAEQDRWRQQEAKR